MPQYSPTPIRYGIVFACLAAFCGLAWTADNEAGGDSLGLSAGLSYDFSRGKYGGPDQVKEWTRTLNVEYDRGDYTFALSVPYLRVYGPQGTVLVGGKPLRRNGVLVLRGGHVVLTPIKSVTTFGTQEGMGDVTVAGTWFNTGAASDDNAPLVDATLDIKLPTADKDKGLGTGKTDYSLQADISQSYGTWTVSGSLGYAIIGKVEETTLRNYFYGSADLSDKLGDKTRIGLTLNYGQSAASGSSNTEDLTLYCSYAMTKAAKFQAYLLKGYQTASPDNGVGVSLTFSF